MSTDHYKNPLQVVTDRYSSNELNMKTKHYNQMETYNRVGIALSSILDKVH